MTDECEHEWELGQITTDRWNTISRIEWAYYFCSRCLKTIKKQVNEPETKYDAVEEESE